MADQRGQGNASATGIQQFFTWKIPPVTSLLTYQKRFWGSECIKSVWRPSRWAYSAPLDPRWTKGRGSFAAWKDKEDRTRKGQTGEKRGEIMPLPPVPGSATAMETTDFYGHYGAAWYRRVENTTGTRRRHGGHVIESRDWVSRCGSYQSSLPVLAGDERTRGAGSFINQ